MAQESHFSATESADFGLLTKEEQAFTIGLLEGKSAIKAMNEVYERFPEFPRMTDRAAQKWVHKPRIQAILQAAKQGQEDVIVSYQVERVISVLPELNAEWIQGLKKGTRAINAGLDRMYEILDSDEVGSRTQVEALRAVTSAVKDLAALAGIMIKVNQATSKERKGVDQGLTREFAEFLRRDFLGGSPDVGTTEEVEVLPEANEALADWDSRFDETHGTESIAVIPEPTQSQIDLDDMEF